MLLVAGALLCSHHIDRNELVKQIERVDLRIGVVDQHVHEVGQRDIHTTTKESEKGQTYASIRS